MMEQRSTYFCQSSDLNIRVVLGLTAHVLCWVMEKLLIFQLFWLFPLVDGCEHFQILMCHAQTESHIC